MMIEEAIEVLQKNYPDSCYSMLREAVDMAIEALKTVQEHKDTFEWCVECKEYDQEQHCCHRWTKQIRKTIAEFEEDNGIVRCNECIFYMAMGENRAWGKCRIHDRTAQDIDYCSWGERKES